MEEVKDYSFLEPMPGYIVIKTVEEESKGLITTGQSEDRAYGKVVSLPLDYIGRLELGDLVVYNEYEGQELFKFGKIDEEGLIVLKEADVLLKVKQ